MPANNFKLFDQNKANLLSDTEYVNATQRLNGVQTGVASSQLQNKFAYQVSLVAYAIAQIMNQNGLDASDTLAVSAFVGNLGGSLLQKVADKASTAEAAAGVLTNKYISPATMKAAALLLSGGVMAGTLDMNNNKITNLPTPTTPSEPATKGYVDGRTTKWVKVSNLTVNNFTSERYNTIVGSFSHFSLNNIESIKSARFKGIINIENVMIDLSNAGITLFDTYNDLCLHLVYFPRREFFTYSNFSIDVIIPATIVKYTQSKGIYCSPLTYLTESFANRYFGDGTDVKLYNACTDSPLSCNIDMYLEVVE